MNSEVLPATYSSRTLVFALGCFYTKTATFKELLKNLHNSSPLKVELRLSKASNPGNIIAHIQTLHDTQLEITTMTAQGHIAT